MDVDRVDLVILGLVVDLLLVICGLYVEACVYLGICVVDWTLRVVANFILTDTVDGLLAVVMYGTLAVVAAVDAILAVVGVVFPLLGSCG